MRRFHPPPIPYGLNDESTLDASAQDFSSGSEAPLRAAGRARIASVAAQDERCRGRPIVECDAALITVDAADMAGQILFAAIVGQDGSPGPRQCLPMRAISAP